MNDRSAPPDRRVLVRVVATLAALPPACAPGRDAPLPVELVVAADPLTQPDFLDRIDVVVEEGRVVLEHDR